MKDLSVSFDDGLNKLKQIFDKNIFKDIASNSAQSVTALISMNKHLVSLLAKFAAVPSTAPAAAAPPPTEPVTQVEPEIDTTGVTTAKNERRVRKTFLLFCCSGERCV